MEKGSAHPISSLNSKQLNEEINMKSKVSMLLIGCIFFTAVSAMAKPLVINLGYAASQGSTYSVLADNIASSKGMTLTKTIPDEMGTMITILRVLVYAGTAVLFWIFVLRPFWTRRKNGKQ